ncbi:hypothetical protein [Plastoroseomonas arctica]|uniref:Transmembrane protein n=1 Tax=Plastoroseomonas arctica TaxID=1509237 RepID=A0AAF1JX46_9PROT|nr:hypothetical protein [Plastoroseomonas arctica]MBR0655337.1 hypothetical protein [Plastoroseomonas arctica]
MDHAQALAQAILNAFADPVVLLPALALGWWAGPRWMLLSGCLGLGIVRLAASLGEGEADVDAAIPWIAAFAAPLLAAGAARLLRRLLSGQDPNARPRTAPRLVVAFFGAMLGLVLGFGLGLVVGLAVVWTSEAAEHGSQASIIALLFILPAQAIGFFAGGIVAFIRAGRRRGVPA